MLSRSTVKINSEVEVKNDTGNPIPVSGTVNIGTIPEVEIKNDTGNPVSISGSVSVSNTVPVSGTVNIGTIPEVEVKNDTGNPLAIVDNNRAPVGVQGNGWNNAAVAANGVSNAVNIPYQVFVTCFGHVSAATTLTLQISQDGTNFYDTAVTAAPSGAVDFYLGTNIGAAYIRLKTSNAVTITATLSAKD